VCAADPPRGARPSRASPFTSDQLLWRQFFPLFTWLDIARGGSYLHPDAIRPHTLVDTLVDDFNDLLYGSELVQSAWARSTRISYQSWVTAFCTFCHEQGCRPLPVDPEVFILWLERLVTKLAGRTVTVAISAIVAWCALNNLHNPIEANPMLRLAWRGLVRTRSVRVGPQKLPLSETFVLAVYRDFMRHHSSDPGRDFPLLRSVAWLLSGFESGPRVQECCLFTRCNVWPHSDGSADIRFLNTKNNYGQHYLNSVTTLAPPSHPLGLFPSAAGFLATIYLPELDRLGIVRHPDCGATPESMAPCRVCPRLFPTIPQGHTRARPLSGTMTSQHVSTMVRYWLTRLGVESPCRWSGVSMRQGCASLAAVMKVAPEIVKWHIRWSRGVPGTYTVKPPDARLAVSLAVGRSYVAASAASARRPASSYSDLCHVCDDGGADLLLCDSDLCRRVAHPLCVGLSKVPGGLWFCPVCSTPPVSPALANGKRNGKKKG